MAPAPGEVRTGSWDQTDILLGEIARGKKIIVGADHQRRHRDAVELRAPVESQDGVEPTRLNFRPAQIGAVTRFFGGQQATAAPIRTADAAPETTSMPIQLNPARSAQPNPAKPAFKNFNEIGALEDGDTIVLPKVSSKKPREREEESQRLKRIMAICSGC
jgi:hypothetical protein